MQKPVVERYRGYFGRGELALKLTNYIDNMSRAVFREYNSYMEDSYEFIKSKGFEQEFLEYRRGLKHKKQEERG